MTTKQERFVKFMKSQIEKREERIKSWAFDKLLVNPVHSLEWSLQIFREAAELELLRQQLLPFSDGEPYSDKAFTQYIDSLNDAVPATLQAMAGRPRHSSNPLDNIMHQERMAAVVWFWRDILRKPHIWNHNQE